MNPSVPPAPSPLVAALAGLLAALAFVAAALLGTHRLPSPPPDVAPAVHGTSEAP